MNRDQRNCHYQSFSNLHLVDDSSFLPKKPSHSKKMSSKLSMNNLNHQFSSTRNYSSLALDDSISFAARNSPQKGSISQKNIIPNRQSIKQPDKTPSTYQHSQCGKSNIGSVTDKHERNKKPQISKDSGHIYQEIIKILEGENHNLKQQNKYMLGEYKNITLENNRLKQQVETLKGYCGLKLQVKKLREINETYQRLVEQLKFILMEEMVAIHQKINFIMSTEDVTELYNQFQASLKRSNTLLNKQRYHVDQRSKQQSQPKSLQGTNLTQMLSLDENEEDQNEQIRTFDTFQSMKNLDPLKRSKYQMSDFDSPTQATFYGNLADSSRRHY